MKRDFTESAKNELLGLVAEVEDEEWCGVTDWLGDRWSDVCAWFGGMDIRDYEGNMREYHKKVIDKEDMTSSDITNIFDKVNGISTSYKSRFLALLTDLQSYKDTIQQLRDVAEPSGGNFTVANMQQLRNNIQDYLKNSEYLLQITDEGISEADVKELAENGEEDRLFNIMNALGKVALEFLPDVKVGMTYEVPIGPGMSFYYSTGMEVKGGGLVSADLAVEEQRLTLEELALSGSTPWGLSGSFNADGEWSLGAKAENIGVGLDEKGFNAYWTWTNDNQTLKFSYSYNFLANQLKIEEKITTDLDEASVYSAMGIKISSAAFPQPAYAYAYAWEPLEEPGTIEMPYENGFAILLDDTWEFISEEAWPVIKDVIIPIGVTVAIVAGVVYIVYTGDPSVIQQAWQWLQQWWAGIQMAFTS